MVGKFSKDKLNYMKQFKLVKVIIGCICVTLENILIKLFSTRNMNIHIED